MHKPISRGATLMLCLCWTALRPTFGESVREGSDAIVFKNGDHLSGTLERVDNDSVQLHSAALGELTIRWTDIAEVESRDHDWKWEGRAEGIGAPGVRFRNAVMRTVDSAVVMQAETQTVPIPKGAALMVEKQEHPTAGLTQLMNPKASPSLPPDTSFALSLNAPQSVVIGTQSQYVFGGNFRVLHNEPNLCSAPSWFSSLLGAANHNKSAKVGNPDVVTDTYDGTLTLSNRLGSETQFAGYGVADLYGNSSLGIGLQQSYGFGINHPLYTNGCEGSTAIEPKGHRLTINGDASIRYIHQRLYAPGGTNDLAGLRLAEDLLYVLYGGKDKSGTPKELFSISQSLWVTPMLNEGRAVQAGGSFGIFVPLNKSLSVGLTEEDEFFNNAPKAKRKNYLKNGVTVTYTFPAATP
jgi:hypothetical protein